MALEINEGALIYTSDDKQIGKVKTVESDAVHVDAPHARDYWLELGIVKSASETRVDLTIAEADLGAYKMDRPHDPNAYQEGPGATADPSHVRAQSIRGGGHPII